MPEKSKLAICKAFLYMLTYLTGGFIWKKIIKKNAFERLSLADKGNIKLISDKNEVLTIKDTLKDPVLIPINEDLDNISEEKLVKIIRK